MQQLLKTTREIKRDKVREKIIGQYYAIASETASNWCKATAIAKKLDLSAGFVARVIKAHNEAKNESNR